MIYFNVKYQGKVETIDSLNKEDFNTYKAYKKEVNFMLKEYHIAGQAVYLSQRCTNDWLAR